MTKGKPAPTVGVVRAFHVHDRRLRPLPGGQGVAWSDGRVVLKPVDFAPAHDWVCDVYAGWTSHDTVRVPEPVKSYDDTWVIEGWAAHVWVAGRDAVVPDELDAIREASDAFHDAVSYLKRPDWMDDRHDPWAFGDRIAWEGAQLEGDPVILALAETLRDALRPVRSADQVIHGDILPNVLVADRLPPAVIDWPPYFRPRAMALAIAATDAVTFRGVSTDLFDEWASGPEWDQLLLRSLLYRLGPTGYFNARDRLTGSLVSHVERVHPVADEVLARLRRAARH